MDLACLFSGGKDSNYALYWALNQGFSVSSLVSVVPKLDDSYMFHIPCLELVPLQAEALGIPLIQKEVSGVKEEEVLELEKIISKLKIDGIVSGAVASEYQRTRIDSICEKLNLKSYNPLWHKPQDQVLVDIVNAGFKVVVVGIAAEGLTEDWLGRIIDAKAIQELKELSIKYSINSAGEGGEYETFVIDGPTFKKKIDFKETVNKMTGPNSGILEVKKAVLE